MNKIFSIFIFLITHSLLSAQDIKGNEIFVLAKYNSSTNILSLRWAANNANLYNKMKLHGVKIKSMQTMSNYSPLSIEDMTNSIKEVALVFPYTQDYLHDYPLVNSNMGTLVENLLFQSTPDETLPTVTKLGDVIRYNDSRSQKYDLITFAADQSFEAAKAFGLGYEIKIIEPDKNTFAYNFYLNDEDETYLGTTIISTEFSTEYSPVSSYSAVGGDKKITLEWSTQGVDSVYTFYNIYRSDNNNSFVKMNTEPFLFLSTESNVTNTMTYIDSLPQNKKLYYYYIRGINPFGEEGPASTVVSAMGKRARLDINFAIDSFAVVMGNQLALKWKISPLFADNNATLNQAKTFKIMYGASSEITPTVLNTSYAKNVRQVIIPFQGSGYYYIKMIDSSDYVYSTLSKFIQTPDTIAPAAPTNLVAERNSDGKVVLKWTKNTELDLSGYKVYYATQSSGPFMEVTTELMTQPTFTEILDADNPNAKMHYKIAAVDKVYNISALSQEAVVTLPNASPITAPIITSTYPRPEGIRIGWQLQKSILKYDLQRKLKSESKWTTIFTFKGDNSSYPPLPSVPNEPNQANYIDNSPLELKFYDYRLFASDDFGNQTASRKVTEKPYDDGLRGSVNTFSATLMPPNQYYYDYQPAYFDEQNITGTVVQLKPDGKVAKLLWNYTSIYGASLREFKIYIKDDVPPSNTDGDLVKTFTLVKSIKKQIATGTSNTISAPTPYATYIDRIQFRKNFPKKIKIVAYHNDGGFSIPVEITLYP